MKLLHKTEGLLIEEIEEGFIKITYQGGSVLTEDGHLTFPQEVYLNTNAVGLLEALANLSQSDDADADAEETDATATDPDAVPKRRGRPKKHVEPEIPTDKEDAE